MTLKKFDTLVGSNSYVRCRGKKRIDPAIIPIESAQTHLYDGGSIGWWVRDGYIIVDVDEGKEKFLEVLKVLKIKTLMAKTPKGVHLFFKTKKDFPQRIGMILPCGLKCDYRCADKGYIVLPFGMDGRSFNNIHEIAELPLEFTPMTNRKDSLLNLKEGDGRNTKLFAHLMAYRNNGANDDQVEQVAHTINDIIFAEPMDKAELNKILDSTTRYEVSAYPHLDKNGKPYKHWENTEYLLEKEGIHFRYNKLNKKPETDYKRFKILSQDSIVTELRSMFMEKGYSLSRQDTSDHILRIAEKNAFHPVQDYLKKCLDEWDGKSRLRDFFDNIFTLDPAINQDVDFAYTLFKKWLITLALLPFNEGEDAAQGVLVLVGHQGAGKTRFMLKLLPNSGWGSTGRMLDLRNKDSIIEAVKFWIVELGEYGRNITAEKTDHYKAFITNNTDTFRIPFAREAGTYPRTAVFYATTDTHNFLKDDAGERRNWVIAISHVNDVDIDLNQLWGEITHLALIAKEAHWLSRKEITQLNMNNENYKQRTADYELLYDSLNWDAPKDSWIKLTSMRICKALNHDTHRSPVIGKALVQMKSLGVEKSKNTGKKEYLIPPFKSSLAMARINHDIQ